MSAAPLIDRWFDEYTVGRIEEAGSAVISADDIADFARITGDDHPAHVDAQFAEARFGGLLSHGVLTFAVVVGLTVEHNRRAVAYGYERIRFPAPVLAGDVIRATSEVVDIAEHPRNTAIGLVTKAYTGVNQRGTTVLACRHILAVDRRPEKEHPHD